VPQRTIERPVDETIVSSLQTHFEDFRRAIDVDGMDPDEFVSFGASMHTIEQFLGGYQKLLDLVRKRMLHR
jgi:transaldolase